MKLLFHIGAVVCLAIGLNACASSTDYTHDPKLLDDKVTSQRVALALKNAGSDFQGIKVETNNGETILSGTVPSQSARDRAEALIRALPRVTKLRNDIQVQ